MTAASAGARRRCDGCCEQAQVVRQALGRELIDRERDALTTSVVEQHDARRMLAASHLRLDAERTPDALEFGIAPAEESHPAGQVVPADEAPADAIVSAAAFLHTVASHCAVAASTSGMGPRAFSA